jgi:hypothetical protein
MAIGQPFEIFVVIIARKKIWSPERLLFRNLIRA